MGGAGAGRALVRRHLPWPCINSHHMHRDPPRPTRRALQVIEQVPDRAGLAKCQELVTAEVALVLASGFGPARDPQAISTTDNIGERIASFVGMEGAVDGDGGAHGYPISLVRPRDYPVSPGPGAWC